MLDLQPGVHLEEVEAAVRADDQLHRAGAVIADRRRQPHCLLAHLAAHLGRHERGRRFLDDLLVPPLDRAFALAQIDDVAMAVAEHLDLDVARLLDELLDEHAVVAEARQPLALGGVEALAHLGLAPREAHALAAAAGRGLHHHRIADLPGDPDRMLGVRDLADEARHHRDARELRQLLRFDLVAHRRDGGGRRPDEHDPRVGAGPGEPLAFRQEAVARMHRLRPRRPARRDDRLAQQVALGGRRRPQPHRLVRHLDMQRRRVGIRIDRDGPDPHPAACLDDPARDLAAVGDQNLVEQSDLPLQSFNRRQGRSSSDVALATNGAA